MEYSRGLASERSTCSDHVPCDLRGGCSDQNCDNDAATFKTNSLRMLDGDHVAVKCEAQKRWTISTERSGSDSTLRKTEKERTTTLERVHGYRAPLGRHAKYASVLARYIQYYSRLSSLSIPITGRYVAFDNVRHAFIFTIVNIGRVGAHTRSSSKAMSVTVTACLAELLTPSGSHMDIHLHLLRHSQSHACHAQTLAIDRITYAAVLLLTLHTCNFR